MDHLSPLWKIEVPKIEAELWIYNIIEARDDLLPIYYHYGVDNTLQLGHKTVWNWRFISNVSPYSATGEVAQQNIHA